MHISFNPNFTKPNFKGITHIKALTDSHQEARLEAQLLSKIAQDAKNNNNILLLNCGDLFGGVYSRDLMVDLYLQFKKENPDVEVVMTIGNNDPISTKDKYAPKNPNDKRNGIEFFKDAIQEFETSGIHIVCANLKDRQTQKTPSWIKPYTIVERDGDRIFVTGFCIDRLPSDKLNVDVIPQDSAFDGLIDAINKEKPDSIIILNHDYPDKADKLIKYAESKGITIDVVINGHEHDENNLSHQNCFAPAAFSKGMFEMDLAIKNKVSKILNIKEARSEDLSLDESLKKPIEEYEKKSKITDVIAKHTLNLPKRYAHPCAIGTFIADGIKEQSEADVAFFASNVIRVPIYYQEGKNVTNYDIRKTITFDSTVQRAEFNPDELKEILTSAYKDRVRLKDQNSRFLQCSSNLKIVDEENESTGTCKIKQIFLNNIALLDEKGNAIDPTRKIKCAFDNYIPTDGRSASLENAQKEDVFVDGKKLRIDEVLKKQFKKAEGKYKKGMDYPKFELETIKL